MSSYEGHIRGVISSNIADSNEIIASIIALQAAECVDDNCNHGAAQLAGSIWQLAVFGMLNVLGMRANDSGVREIRGYTHEDCGFLAVQLGLYTRQSQNKYADRILNPTVNTILQPYNVKVVWARRDPMGTATEWMQEMNAR